MAGLRLEARGVSKSYGSVRALTEVSASFSGGEIHGILGENGAGKSTLMGILSGFVRPDSGAIALNGKPVPTGDPGACKALGVELIHQHFMLVPEFTVAENLSLAAMGTLARALDPKTTAERALEMGRRLGWDFDPTSRISSLSVGVQQRLEILKALATEADTLIFDEPTAVLAPGEIEELFRVLRSLRDQGKLILLIAHKLQEALSVMDRVTVLRQGRVVATADRSDVDGPKLASWMVGELPESHMNVPTVLGESLLEATDLQALGDRRELAVRGVNLAVRSGEIVGIGGVDGNGQVEFAEALAGVRPPSAGCVVATGPVGYIPQDRQIDGLALSLSIRDNMLVTGHRRADLTRGPFLLGGRVDGWAEGLIDRFDIRVGSIRDLASSLSGGNQQKVVVSRILDGNPRVIVAVNPTRGLDIRAAEFVHEQLRIARRNGAAVVVFSTDLDELAILADRTLFMSRGKFVEGSDALAVVGGEN